MDVIVQDIYIYIAEVLTYTYLATCANINRRERINVNGLIYSPNPIVHSSLNVDNFKNCIRIYSSTEQEGQ